MNQIQKQNDHLIHMKNTASKKIIIPKNIVSNPSSPSNKIDYSLHNHFFDPSKSSPPNDFLLKLEKRLQFHYSLGTNDSKLVNT